MKLLSLNLQPLPYTKLPFTYAIIERTAMLRNVFAFLILTSIPNSFCTPGSPCKMKGCHIFMYLFMYLIMNKFGMSIACQQEICFIPNKLRLVILWLILLDCKIFVISILKVAIAKSFRSLITLYNILYISVQCSRCKDKSKNITVTLRQLIFCRNWYEKYKKPEL